MAGLAVRCAGLSTRVFLSYSRRDSYAAEYLTSGLLRAGLDPWLDFHRLEPGVDWAQEIRDAIAAAGIFVLLASPEAIRSAYVQSEWRDAIARGKPVFVVLVRKVALPAELARYPLIDLRPSPAAGLSGLLAGFGMRPEPRRAPRVFRLPWVASALCAFHVALAAVCAVLDVRLPRDYLRGIADAPVALAMGPALAVVVVVIAVGLVFVLGSVLRSRYRWEYGFFAGFVMLLTALQLMFTRVWLIAHYSATGAKILPAGLYRGCQVLAGLLVLDIVLLAAAICYAGISTTLLIRSESLAGSLAPRFRVLAGTGLQVGTDLGGMFPKWGAPVLAMKHEVRYRLDFAPADERLAVLVRDVLAGLEFTEDPARPDWTFVLVTGFTDLDRLESAPDDQRTIFLLGSSVASSPDAALFRAHQWIDFRDPSPAALRQFLNSLDHTEVEPAVQAPRSPTVFAAPAYVQLCYFYALGTGSLLLMLSGKLFWAGELTPLSVLRAVVAVVTAGMLLGTGRRIAARRMSVRAAGWLRVVVPLLVTLAAVLWTVSHELPGGGIETILPAHDGDPPSREVFRTWLAACDVLMGLVLAGIGATIFALIGRAARWLPTRPVAAARPVYPAWSKFAVFVVAIAIMTGFMIAFPVVA